MKYFILALFLGLFSFNMLAQTAKPEGVGKFKINKTDISIIQELEKDLGVKCKKVSNRTEQASEKKKDFYFIELPDSIINNVYCLKVRVFEIKTYKISNIEFNQLMLIFYNDKLVTLSSQANEQIEEAFRLKYQVGKTHYKREKTDCDRFFENSYAYEVWLNNDISAILSYRHYKDDTSCQESYDFSLYIYSNLYNKKEDACIQDIVKKREDQKAAEEFRKKQKELEKIKDF